MYGDCKLVSLQMSTAKSRCHPHWRASSDSLGCCAADVLPPSDSQHSQRYCGLLQARKSPCMDSSSSCQMALGYLRRAASTATHDDPAASRKLVSKSASGRHRAKSVSGKTMIRLMMLWRAPSKNASKTSGQDNRAKLERVCSTLQAALSLPRHTQVAWQPCGRRLYQPWAKAAVPFPNWPRKLTLFASLRCQAFDGLPHKLRRTSDACTSALIEVYSGEAQTLMGRVLRERLLPAPACHHPLPQGCDTTVPLLEPFKLCHR